MPSFDPRPSELSVVLNRAKVVNRRLLDQHPDLFASLEVRTRLMQDLVGDMVVDLVGYVYVEKLPPVQVTRSRDIHIEREFHVVAEVIDGPWQRHKYHHRRRWWIRLPMWCRLMRPVRYRQTPVTVQVVHDEKVTLTVDLQGHRAYPQSRIGSPDRIGLGAKVIRGHDLNAWWSHE